MTLLKQHIEESQKEFEEKFPTKQIEYPYIKSFLTSREKLLVEKLIKEIKNNLPKVITPTVEPPPNHLSQNQIFAGGQVNMATRVIEELDDLLKSLE